MLHFVSKIKCSRQLSVTVSSTKFHQKQPSNLKCDSVDMAFPARVHILYFEKATPDM